MVPNGLPEENKCFKNRSFFDMIFGDLKKTAQNQISTKYKCTEQQAFAIDLWHKTNTSSTHD